MRWLVRRSSHWVGKFNLKGWEWLYFNLGFWNTYSLKDVGHNMLDSMLGKCWKLLLTGMKSSNRINRDEVGKNKTRILIANYDEVFKILLDAR